MRIASKLIRLVRSVVLLAMLSIAFPSIAVSPITCGGRVQPINLYDGTPAPTFYYDSASTLIANDNENRTGGRSGVFADLPGFLAAKGATHWANPKTLADHFARHGADFGAKSADDYARAASDFFRRSQAERLPTKIAPDGTIRVYDPKNNIFGSYNASGTTKTFYKPDPAQHGLRSNLDYWNKQPGVAPWEP